MLRVRKVYAFMYNNHPHVEITKNLRLYFIFLFLEE